MFDIKLAPIDGFLAEKTLCALPANPTRKKAVIKWYKAREYHSGIIQNDSFSHDDFSISQCWARFNETVVFPKIILVWVYFATKGSGFFEIKQ